MKKIAFWLITLVMPVVLLAQEENNYSITGEVKGDGVREVYLSYFGGHGIQTDSARVVDHLYRLTGKVVTGMTVSLTSAGPDDVPTPDQLVTLFLQPSESFRIVHGKSFSDAVITGSPANLAYDQLMQLSKGYAARKAGQPGEGEREEVYGRYMLENPNSPLLYYAFREYTGNLRWISSGDVPKVRSLMDMLPDSIRHSATITFVSQALDKKVTFDETVGIGQPAPDFTQNDTAGHPVSLSSFRGKYVLLDFWASWCGPCRQENPAVVSAYREYHEKGFEILGVSLDQNEKLWKKAIRDDKLNWTHVSDLKYWSNALVKLYGVQGVPQNFLIDPQGNIVARGLRGTELDKKLSEIYKN